MGLELHPHPHPSSGPKLKSQAEEPLRFRRDLWLLVNSKGNKYKINFSVCRVFVRALFRVRGLVDKKYNFTTTSNEITTTRIDPLIDLLTRPLLKVTRIGLQMASLSWKLDDSVDQSLIKGYRIILNSKPNEILPPNQHEYELRNIKPGIYLYE